MMKTTFKAALLLAGCTLGASLANAQETPDTTAPQAGAQAQADATVTDQEVDAFASALVDINKVQADTTLQAADKQQKMVAVLQQNGLEPARFNAIAQAAQTDTALNQKIQTAAQAKAGGQ